MSSAPIRIGTDQLPDPPIIDGITIKKIIKKAYSNGKIPNLHHLISSTPTVD
ncbi:hypothetical protein MTR_8g007495 [Medicago truncatula]|uniref:Uncharacterized protein n=1 Tax=Medicago truncatula TaxID=3880 RepID=A0A072TKJ0_MEDTR|nr:hypothetical protein MTR_8g007495 [Medicago truncatula]